MKNIIKGHVNEMINSEEELYNERISICKSCMLYKHTVLGPICNSNLYLNTETQDVSTTEKPGYTRGCGCRLNAKTRIPESSCPVNKW
jgi:hypothetical protein